jgi:hypothetical protein
MVIFSLHISLPTVALQKVTVLILPHHNFCWFERPTVMAPPHTTWLHLGQLVSTHKTDATFSFATLTSAQSTTTQCHKLWRPPTVQLHSVTNCDVRPQYNYTVSQPRKPQFFEHDKHPHLIWFTQNRHANYTNIKKIWKLILIFCQHYYTC